MLENVALMYHRASNVLRNYRTSRSISPYLIPAVSVYLSTETPSSPPRRKVKVRRQYKFLPSEDPTSSTPSPPAIQPSTSKWGQSFIDGKESSPNLEHNSPKHGSGTGLVDRGEENKDIVLDDLQATLEAHRATNRASVVRKFEHDPDPDWIFETRRLTLSNSSLDNLGEVGNPTLLPATLVEKQNNSSKKLTKPKIVDCFQEAEETESEEVDVEEAGVEESAALDGSELDQSADKGIEYAMRVRGIWSYEGPGQRPWLNLLNSNEGDSLSRLNNEIKAFESYMQHTPMESLAVEALIKKITAVVSEALPSHPLILHGSRSTGLAIPCSDVDFCLFLPEREKDPLERTLSPRGGPHRKSLSLLQTVARTLQRFKRFSDVTIINARIPIVTFHDSPSGLKVQFQANTPVVPAREYTIYYLSEIPTLRSLFVVLRSCLQIRDHNDVVKGGIGSYALLIMIVAAMKHGPQTLAREGVASQLLHVLDFWATADLTKNGFSVDPPRVFSKRKTITLAEKEAHARDVYLRGIDKIRKPRSSQDRLRFWLLCLQDPANPVNDLGKNTFRIKRIQTVFRETRKHILKDLVHWENMTMNSRETRQKAVLGALLSARYDIFQAKRRKLQSSVLVGLEPKE